MGDQILTNDSDFLFKSNVNVSKGNISEMCVNYIVVDGISGFDHSNKIHF